MVVEMCSGLSVVMGTGRAGGALAPSSSPASLPSSCFYPIILCCVIVLEGGD